MPFTAALDSGFIKNVFSGHTIDNRQARSEDFNCLTPTQGSNRSGMKESDLNLLGACNEIEMPKLSP
jgi:hypothetical protein